MATMYVKDDEGNSFIAASQRPDGSWRKPRRVKDGFVPQEEVPLYESKGKKYAKEREVLLPPGVTPELWEQLKANQEKLFKKMDQDILKYQGKTSSNNANSNKGSNAKNKDAVNKNNGKSNKGKNAGPTTGKSSNNVAIDKTKETNVSASILSTPLIIPGITGDDSEWVTVTSKKKKKTKSKEEAAKVGGTGPVGKDSANNPVNTIKLNNSVRIVETEKGIKVTNEAGQPLTTDPARKLRNLKKKLKDIEKLKSMDPKKLEKEQKEKVKTENEVKAIIHQLEVSLGISG